jgi:hypothetical protein
MKILELKIPTMPSGGLTTCKIMTFNLRPSGEKYVKPCPAFVTAIDCIGDNKFSELLAGIHKNLDSAVEYTLNGNQLSSSFRAKSPRLAELIESISEGAQFEEEEICRDGYVDLQAFLDYIRAVVEVSPTFWVSTEGYDHDTMPGMSSSYHVHWDNDPKAAIIFISELVAEDVRRLQTKKYRSTT